MGDRGWGAALHGKRVAAVIIYNDSADGGVNRKRQKATRKNSRACRKLWRRPHDGLYRLRFYALLAAGSPKQTDSSWFCSHTVQAPAKPNPFLSHSMASNPRIVRRAVWEAWIVRM